MKSSFTCEDNKVFSTLPSYIVQMHVCFTNFPIWVEGAIFLISVYPFSNTRYPHENTIDKGDILVTGKIKYSPDYKLMFLSHQPPNQHPIKYPLDLILIKIIKHGVMPINHVQSISDNVINVDGDLIGLVQKEDWYNDSDNLHEKRLWEPSRINGLIQFDNFICEETDHIKLAKTCRKNLWDGVFK